MFVQWLSHNASLYIYTVLAVQETRGGLLGDQLLYKSIISWDWLYECWLALCKFTQESLFTTGQCKDLEFNVQRMDDQRNI